MTTALWWVRRDLRLADNQALHAATSGSDRVVPVVILEPGTEDQQHNSAKRQAFFLAGLRDLDASLQSRGSRLVVRQGDPLVELPALVRELGAVAVFAEEDPTPTGRQRDGRMAEIVPLIVTGGLTIRPPDGVTKADGSPYTVFTPYSRKWKALPLPSRESLLPAPQSLPEVVEVPSLALPLTPALPDAIPFPAGEGEALRRLQAFADTDRGPIFRYVEGRDRVDWDGTSGLSPYLRFGMISARQAAAAALRALEARRDAQAQEGASVWLNELIWREFYIMILHYFPYVAERSFRASLAGIVWDRDEAPFVAWCEGRTGYPMVDASMRHLTQTGWMHNRARMIVASFLVKDLLVDWRRGERFFMQHLVDGDLPANNGGWQWVAGTGTDAAPYFRVFNPVTQGKKHDPHGTFTRRWLPELAQVPDKFIHEPWKMPAEVQKACNCIIGHQYPGPIIDHGWARERTLRAYRQARDGSRS